MFARINVEMVFFTNTVQGGSTCWSSWLKAIKIRGFSKQPGSAVRSGLVSQYLYNNAAICSLKGALSRRFCCMLVKCLTKNTFFLHEVTLRARGGKYEIIQLREDKL